MDIFHIESANSNATIVNTNSANALNNLNNVISADEDDEIVSFDAGTDFNLNFFESSESSQQLPTSSTTAVTDDCSNTSSTANNSISTPAKSGTFP